MAINGLVVKDEEKVGFRSEDNRLRALGELLQPFLGGADNGVIGPSVADGADLCKSNELLSGSIFVVVYLL